MSHDRGPRIRRVVLRLRDDGDCQEPTVEPELDSTSMVGGDTMGCLGPSRHRQEGKTDHQKPSHSLAILLGGKLAKH